MKLFHFTSAPQTKFCWNIDGDGHKEEKINTSFVETKIMNSEIIEPKAEDIISEVENEYKIQMERKTPDQILNITKNIQDLLSAYVKNDSDSNEIKEYRENLLTTLGGSMDDIYRGIVRNINEEMSKKAEYAIDFTIITEKTKISHEGILGEQELYDKKKNLGREIVVRQRTKLLKEQKRSAPFLPEFENVTIPKKIKSALEKYWSKEFSLAIEEAPDKNNLEVSLNKLLENYVERGKNVSLDFFGQVTPTEFVQVLRAFSANGSRGIPEIKKYATKLHYEHLNKNKNLIRLQETQTIIEQHDLKVETITTINPKEKIKDQENYDFMTKEGREKLLGIILTNLREDHGENLKDVTKITIENSRNALRYSNDAARETLKDFAKGKGIPLGGGVDYQKIASQYWSETIEKAVRSEFPNWKGSIEIDESKLGATGAPSVYTLSSEYSNDPRKANQLLSFENCSSETAYPDIVQGPMRKFLEENGIKIDGAITKKKILENPNFSVEIGNKLYREVLVPHEGEIKQAYERWNQTNIQVVSEEESSNPPKIDKAISGIAIQFTELSILETQKSKSGGTNDSFATDTVSTGGKNSNGCAAYSNIGGGADW